MAQNRAALFAVLSLVILTGLAALFLFLPSDRSQSEVLAEDQNTDREDQTSTIKEDADTNVSEPYQVVVAPDVPTEIPAPDAHLEPESVIDHEKEPTHFYNGMDPEDQPRSFARDTFAGLSHYPEGFNVIGDNVRLSEEGWTLAPPSPSEVGTPRSGMIESPVYELEFSSNALSPIWKETSPEGTEILVEVAASPDGENWTSWYPTTGAHTAGAITEYDRDGNKNPNYGFTRGDMVFFGLGRYKYIKYNMVLYSESADSPTLSDFGVYYQDSTMGDGHDVEYVGVQAEAESAEGQ